jgi:hypothetical protein
MTASKALQDVRVLEEQGLGGEALQKAGKEYYDAFMPVYQNLNPENPAPFCHTAAAQMDNHQILGSNATLRYEDFIVLMQTAEILTVGMLGSVTNFVRIHCHTGAAPVSLKNVENGMKNSHSRRCPP